MSKPKVNYRKYTKTRSPEDKDYQEGGITGKGFKPGKSGNPGGKTKKLTTLLSESITEALGDISQDDQRTFAEIIGHGLVRGLGRMASKGRITPTFIQGVKEVRDTTEGRPAQKVILDDKRDLDTDERIIELLRLAAERSASQSQP